MVFYSFFTKTFSFVTLTAGKIQNQGGIVPEFAFKDFNLPNCGRCGHKTAYNVNKDRVGLNSAHQLVIYWSCEKCKAYLYHSIPIANLHGYVPAAPKNQPPPPETKTEVEKPKEWKPTEQDFAFLKALKISDPDDTGK